MWTAVTKDLISTPERKSHDLPAGAPSWEHSSSVTNCPYCGVEFTFWTRKHHCRSCGRVVCDNCSMKRVELPHYGFEKPERVCDFCHKRINDPIPSMLYWMSGADGNGTVAASSTESRTLLKAYEPGDFFEQVVREEFTSPSAPNSRVVQYWNTLVSDNKYQEELRGRVLVGIPNYMRGMVWKQLSEASLCNQKNQSLYGSLSQTPHPDFEEMIRNDVHRTFPTCPLFADDGGYGQQALFRILRAYCHMNNDYSQCMSYIAAVLLMHLNEEDAFFVFVQMMKKYGLEAIFQRDLPHCLRNLNRFVELSRPDLYNHLTNEKLSVEIFVSGWLQTLFAQQFDLGLVFRLWDVFFAYGFIFLIKASVVLLHHAEPTLLKLGNTDIIFNLKSLPARVQDFDRLIEEAVSLEIPESILDADTEEERLLTITPTINFDIPKTADGGTHNPRLSLHLSSDSLSTVSLASPSSPSSPQSLSRSSSRHLSDLAGEESMLANSPAGTPGSGFIARPVTSKNRSMSPPPRLSASPATRIQLM